MYISSLAHEINLKKKKKKVTSEDAVILNVSILEKVGYELTWFD